MPYLVVVFIPFLLPRRPFPYRPPLHLSHISPVIIRSKTHDMATIMYQPHAGAPYPACTSLILLSPPTSPSSSPNSSSAMSFTLACTAALATHLPFPCTATLGEVHCNKLYSLTPFPVRINEVKSLRRCEAFKLDSSASYNELMEKHRRKVDERTSFLLQIFEGSGRRVLVCTLPEPAGLQVEVSAMKKAVTTLRQCLASKTLKDLRWRDSVLTSILYGTDLSDARPHVVVVGRDELAFGRWYGGSQGKVGGKRGIEPTFKPGEGKKTKLTTATTITTTKITAKQPSAIFAALTPTSAVTARDMVKVRE